MLGVEALGTKVYERNRLVIMRFLKSRNLRKEDDNIAVAVHVQVMGVERLTKRAHQSEVKG